MKSYELINFCELDKYATTSYCAIHGIDSALNLGDITKIDETKLKSFTMICGGSPCTDFSTAGKQKGAVWKCNDCGAEYNPLTVHYGKRSQCPKCHGKNIDKTHSSLLVEWLRVIRTVKPIWGIYENVKNIVGKKFKDTFNMFIHELQEYGYNTYYKVLNSKDYGIPQNRERVYLTIIQKQFDNGNFQFPAPFESNICLKDVLEPIVDEKYYINNEKAEKLINELIQSGKLDDIWKIFGKLNNLIVLCNWGGYCQNKIYSANGISPTLTATQYKHPTKILEVVQNEYKQN